MRPPRHLWTGDWREESARARHEDESRQRSLPRRGVIALVVLSIAGLVAGAFAIGTLTGGGDDAPAPLPAVANTPIKPKKGQTQAAAIYAAASPAVVSVRTGGGSGTGFLINKRGTIV